ncbi:GPW/gp25 family protein [Paenibacillus sp. IB182496]|uniref:GPW/gp25 family protein n=1 Tax=Paenibacillus sabuli TaxID=2772509 RepID=A0A927BYR7_9BACL|nr:GPW/gp25 family protein [Paenibacillus sabuli]MBD2847884.1 GPW/gp25 family protein [Paenibacillus sabuli]
MAASFLGKGWKFPIEVDQTTGRIKMAEDEDDIAEAIRIILWTSKGERVMRPEFGCGVRNFVFESSDETTLRLMETNIQEAIRVWEPRVEDVEVHAVRDEQTLGRLEINIRYVVRSTNNLFNQVYPFYLHEGTK